MERSTQEDLENVATVCSTMEELQSILANSVHYRFPTRKYVKGARIFYIEQYRAIAHKSSLIVGCEDHFWEYWFENYETIGKAHNLTPQQIEIYFKVIKLYHELVTTS